MPGLHAFSCNVAAALDSFVANGFVPKLSIPLDSVTLSGLMDIFHPMGTSEVPGSWEAVLDPESTFVISVGTRAGPAKWELLMSISLCLSLFLPDISLSLQMVGRHTPVSLSSTVERRPSGFQLTYLSSW